jgi:hypothetical protein
MVALMPAGLATAQERLSFPTEAGLLYGALHEKFAASLVLPVP